MSGISSEDGACEMPLPFWESGNGGRGPGAVVVIVLLAGSLDGARYVGLIPVGFSGRAGGGGGCAVRMWREIVLAGRLVVVQEFLISREMGNETNSTRELLRNYRFITAN